ncbi:MAG TPA: hypothetical protein VFK79_18040 [Xanthobacteraceae bacterium]|nr:hypothetical protein [Xanthobacteraceae bacterium]
MMEFAPRRGLLARATRRQKRGRRQVAQPSPSVCLIFGRRCEAISSGKTAAWRETGTGKDCHTLDCRQQQEATMPIFILWAGIPILILGGGFVVYRMIGG